MDEFPVILGFGSCHSVREEAGPDLRNRRLVGLKSVSAAAVVAMGPRVREEVSRPIGFVRPRSG